MSKWEWKKLGDVCKFTRGLTYSKKDEVDFSSNCVLRSTNIDLCKNALVLDELKYINDGIDIPNEKRVKKGSLLICVSNGSKAHLGKVAYIDKDYGYAFGGFMGLLSPQESIDGLYMHYALCTPSYKDYIKSLSDGANINNLKFDDLKNFSIPVPPLSEQKRIVKTLDEKFAKIDKLKTAAETNLKNAKEIFNAELKKVLSNPIWDRMKFSDLLKLKSGDYLNSKDIIDGKYPVYGGNGIIAYHNDYNINGDNVIIGRVGALCGNVRLVTEPIWLTDNAFKITFLKDCFDFSFITYLLNFLNLRSYARQAAQPVISNSSLKDILLPLPPLSEQKRIVAHLDKLSEKVKRLEENYTRTIADCEELKKSILKKTFEGDSRSSRE